MRPPASAARAYLVLGEGDRDFLRDALQRAIAAWRGEWLAAGAGPIALVPEPAPSAERWLAAEAAGASALLLGCPAGWIDAAGALATGQAVDPAPPAPLAARVASAMLEGLATQVLRTLSGEAAPTLARDAEAPPAGWLAPGSGAAIFRCALAPSADVVVALSPRLVAASLPKPHARARPAPVAMTRALEGCPLAVQAVLGEVELELGELARLAPGDVIMLERALDEPLALRVEHGEDVARAHLGTLHGQKAVQVLPRA